MTAKKKKAELPALFAAYDALVHEKHIRADDAQREILIKLQALLDKLDAPPEKSSIKKLINRRTKSAESRGIYIWGNVGRGKSMLMDLFFRHVQLERKRRVHFHKFMQEVHSRLHQLRKTEAVKTGGDPTALVIKELAAELQLLCFDELQAADVVDASLIFRLFDGLMNAGVTIVSTSNHPPASLYTGGVQRERFQKFTALIESRMEVVSLSSPKDYRRQQVMSLSRVYFYPLGPMATTQLQQAIQSIAPDQKPKSVSLSVKGRAVKLHEYGGQIGRATFHELCETALGPADYLAIAAKFDALIVTDIPRLTPEKRNEAKRFVTLIDALYEHKVKLIATAEADYTQLYPTGDGSFEFQRTVSRLAEMQSEPYLKAVKK